jgi:hypothetical protein
MIATENKDTLGTPQFKHKHADDDFHGPDAAVYHISSNYERITLAGQAADVERCKERKYAAVDVSIYVQLALHER